MRRFTRTGCNGLDLSSSLFDQLCRDGKAHGPIRIRTIIYKDDFLATQVFSAPYSLTNAEILEHRFGVYLRSFPRHSNRGGNIGGIGQISEAKFRAHGREGRGTSKWESPFALDLESRNHATRKTLRIWLKTRNIASGL